MSSEVNEFDLVGFIMDFEGGTASDEEVVYGFQTMINEGTVWSLQGTYGRFAENLIHMGVCKGGDEEVSPEEAVQDFKKDYGLDL